VTPERSIRKEKQDKNGGSILQTQERRTFRKSEKRIITENFDLCVVKKPTCRKLLPILRKKIICILLELFLRMILHKLRFRWRIFQSTRAMLIQ
jgi:hypothetical protein